MLAELIAETDLFNEEIVDFNVIFIRQYEDFKDLVRCDVYEKTPQCWLQCMDLMKHQHMANTAVQNNCFDFCVAS